MVKRSNNTPKSGKWVNPADQVRKEARKRELKKNKKQRKMMRDAVLKGKDPLQLLSDMEKIDEMEYSVISQPLLNEQVLKDKRKKIKETWDRVLRLYSKEDRERYLELNKLEIEYKTKRSELIRQFESVRATQHVQVDKIPLPLESNVPFILTSQIPLTNELNVPSVLFSTPHSILKKGVADLRREPNSSQPPGVPPGPPPDLSSDEDEVDDGIPMEVGAKRSRSGEYKSKSRKVRFVNENQETGVNTNEEMVEKCTVYESAEADSVDTNLILNPEDIPLPSPNQFPLSFGPLPGILQWPPPMMTRPPPPPLRPVMPPRLLPPSLRLHLGVSPFRLPPEPPPLRPIRPVPSLLPSKLPTGLSKAASQLQAASNSMQKSKNIAPSEGETKRATTIEAKPQIRSLSVDALRFMPTNLRVKREDRHKKGGGKGGLFSELSKESYTMAPVSNPPASVPTKDDAYQQFLLEMEEFL